ncbi:hypothetical protein H5159_01190 [Pseudoalteromonas sp. SG43-1]|uniref:hypothetical protein n=1 Tax=Pseudoalteromonas sp. SG43-1 TaxID=2760971 RepID=UPI001602D88B|nr:hypothetical protein [Pseudoalteromonas sp. SG43-1]MBB1449701.1 hypothetical protein [Pseudoalteromonas sp. SG43-1]
MEVKKDGDRVIFIHEIPDDSNSPVVECYIDDKITPFRVIEHPEASQHARWQLITKELEFAEAQLIIAIKRMTAPNNLIYLDRRNEAGVIIKALIDSAIVGYIKCFNQTKGRKVKLEVRNFFNKEKGLNYLQLHNLVKDLRNENIAHAGISKSEGSLMIATIDPNPRIGVSSKAIFAHTSFTIPSLEFMKSMLELVRYVLSQHSNDLQVKLDAFCQKAINDPKKYKLEDIY